MTNFYEVNIDNSAGLATIDIEGTIGSPCYTDGKIATYEAFKTKLAEVTAQNVRKVVVSIRSTGGDVQDALLIYDSLKGLKTTVETICYGYTASAATIIAQAANEGKRKMSANGLYLIHQASTSVDGNAEDIEAKVDLLKKTDERIASIYASASNRPVADFTELMAANRGRGKWLTAEEALAYGLIDEIINASKITNQFNPEEQGLPSLPVNHTVMDNKTTVLDRLISWFEKTEAQEVQNTINAKDAEITNLTAERDAAVANVATLTAERDTLNTTLAERDAEIVNLQTQLAEAKAMAVQASASAQPVQDPDPTAGVTKSANQAAYEADLAAFK